MCQNYDGERTGLLDEAIWQMRVTKRELPALGSEDHCLLCGSLRLLLDAVYISGLLPPGGIGFHLAKTSVKAEYPGAEKSARYKYIAAS